jgi:hypothetical protein
MDINTRPPCHSQDTTTSLMTAGITMTEEATGEEEMGRI